METNLIVLLVVGVVVVAFALRTRKGYSWEKKGGTWYLYVAGKIHLTMTALEVETYANERTDGYIDTALKQIAGGEVTS